MDRMVIMEFEPSKRFSEIVGFPYLIEKKIYLSELKSILSKDDIRRMKNGETIKKTLPLEDCIEKRKPNNR